MRPLAVTGTKRHPLLPDVPTFEELGYKDFDGVQWYGIVGPANMPPAIVATLNKAINEALADPAASRAPVGRGARADVDDARAVRQVHARRHRQVDQGGEGPQHRDHGLEAAATGAAWLPRATDPRGDCKKEKRRSARLALQRLIERSLHRVTPSKLRDRFMPAGYGLAKIRDEAAQIALVSDCPSASLWWSRSADT